MALKISCKLVADPLIADPSVATDIDKYITYRLARL